MKKGQRTKEAILLAAVEVAKRDGYTSITRQAVANRAGYAESLINVYFNTMSQLKTDVMRYAIKNNVLSIIAQGVVNGDSRVKKLPESVRTAALNSMG